MKKTPSTPTLTGLKPEILALAVQLFYVHSESDGDCRCPATWSPLDAQALWDRLNVAMQEEWIVYAARVAIFAGVKAYWGRDGRDL